MYKRKLQELCQKRRWAPPLYTCARDGPDHNPRFWASVTVDGATFDGPLDAPSRTSKEAHDAAARIAYHHFAPSAAATEPSPAAATSTPAPPPAPQPLGQPSCKPHGRITTRKLRLWRIKPHDLHLWSILLIRGDLGVFFSFLLLFLLKFKLHGRITTPNFHLWSITTHNLHLWSILLIRGDLGVFLTLLLLFLLKCLDTLHAVAPSAPSAAAPPLPSAAMAKAALPQPSCSSSARIEVDDVSATNEVLKGHGSDVNASAMDDRDMKYLYKIQLQSYAQKRNMNLPTYECVREGSIHAPHFKALVTVAGHTFSSPQFCTTLKDAEHAAAKAALIFLSTGANQEEEHGFYKNLLQELSQKEGLTLPTYSTVSDGPSHMPTFSSTVEIEGERYEGSAAKTKKQAEINAAKVAWTRLRERKLSRLPAGFSSRFQMLDIDDTFASLSLTGSQPPGAGQLPVLRAKPDEEDKIVPDNRAENEVKSINGSLISPSPYDDEAHVTELVGGSGNGDSTERLQVPNPTEKKPRSPSLSSSDAVYATLRDPFPEQPLSSDDEISSASSPSECPGRPATGNGTSVCPAESRSSSLLCNRVRVYPRKPDFQLPPGTKLLPFSDETWVAVCVEHPSEGPITV